MTIKENARYWIDTLDLQPHPEGGYYREIYRSNETIAEKALPERYQENHSLGTSIYYLLEGDQVSHFHKLLSEEIWHFYTGSPLTIHFLSGAEGYFSRQLGHNFENDQSFQIVVPKNTWFGATINIKNSFSVVGCTTSPGFEFSDFELGDREYLLSKHPEHEEIIHLLTQK